MKKWDQTFFSLWLKWDISYLYVKIALLISFMNKGLIRAINTVSETGIISFKRIITFHYHYFLILKTCLNLKHK